MKEYRISKKALLLWKIRVAVIGIILTVICIMLTNIFKWFMYITLAVILLFTFAIFWYLPRLLKNCSCRLVNNTVVLKIGVFFKNTHVFPLLRLIYSQTLTTPLAKKMGLSCVILKAARNHVIIPELTQQEAQELTDYLSRGDQDEI